MAKCSFRLVVYKSDGPDNNPMNSRNQKTMQSLGKKIQKARKAEGYSQEKLAEIVKVSRVHIGHIEQGRKSPSIELLDKIARALHISSGQLLPF